MRKIRKNDWVRCRGASGKHVGIVRRVAKDDSWADVDWGHWTKRMRTESLVVETTIPLDGGWTVTDMNREQELKNAKKEEGAA
jgi:hypothetical protein